MSPPMIVVAAPDGRIAPRAGTLAAVPSALTGLRIGILENGKPNARLLLARIAEAMATRTHMHVNAVVAKATAASPCEAAVLANLRLRADVILTGSGD